MDIDFVIPWVDGADPDWQKVKNQYTPTKAPDSYGENRYRDWGLLPYWFRAVEKYAPWVRTVHFVTWGHLPSFLNSGAAHLHIVRHEDFIPSQYLPTFSSHPIEMNIHRINGLAEHFVYFNDDMFLLRAVKPEHFFRNGLPCTCGLEIPLVWSGKIGSWQHTAANDLGIVNAHFSKKNAVRDYGRKYRAHCYRWKDIFRTYILEKIYPDYFLGFQNIHGPAAYLKSVFHEVWEAEPEMMNNTCLDKFRTSDNLNQWVFLWWQVASGQFSPIVVDNLVKGITSETIDDLCLSIVKQKHDFICLNDPEEEIPFEILAQQLKDAFETVFPQKSHYEK